MNIVEVIWSPEIPAVALAILVQTVLLAVVAASALFLLRRKRSALWSCFCVVIGVFLCASARHIEYPVAEFLYCRFHPQVSSVGFWRIPEAGFWSMHTDWIAPVLGVVGGGISSLWPFRATRHSLKALDCFTMRLLSTLLTCLAVMALAGCKSHSEGSTDPLQELAAARIAEVPLPAATPCDSSSYARAAYLEAYRDGYRSGLVPLNVLIGSPAIGDNYYSARTNGWAAGASAGLSAYSKEIFSNMRAHK